MQNSQTPELPIGTAVTTKPAAVAAKGQKAELVGKILDKVNAFAETGELVLPANYSAANALNAAYLYLLDPQNTGGKNILEVCTQESVANALYEMVIKGLSAVKKQCYFIPYGNTCKLDVSYIGDIAIAKRDANVVSVDAIEIFEGDTFEYEIVAGRIKIIKHLSSIENIDTDKIKGAYAVVTFADSTTKTTVMNKKQILTAWQQGAARGNSPAHQKFAEEMSKKTVISRALKLEIGGSNDEAIMAQKSPAQAEIEAAKAENPQTIKLESTPQAEHKTVTIEANEPDWASN